MPLVADIHFQPAVAMMVAEAFEKVRGHPGERGLCVCVGGGSWRLIH